MSKSYDHASGEESPFLALPVKVVASFLGHYSAIRSVCEDLENIRDAMEALPRLGRVPPARKIHWDFHPTIDWFWVQTGIKGGVASVIDWNSSMARKVRVLEPFAE